MRRLGFTHASEEHPELWELSSSVLAGLTALPSDLGHASGAMVLHHHEVAVRAAELASHLEAARTLADRSAASAFVLLRTALEHACLDELLLLADRYVDRVTMDDREAEETIAAFAARQEPWTLRVHEVKRSRRGVEIVREGIPLVDENGNVVELVSPYHAVLSEHDASLGPEAVQEDVIEPFGDLELTQEWARTNQKVHSRWLRWSAIGENLLLAGRLDRRSLVQLAVHYRFLSAFTHATRTGYEMLDSGRHPGYYRHSPHHYTTELVLLYVVSIAASELQSFLDFERTREPVLLQNRDDHQWRVDEARRLSGYFWFPRVGTPQRLDFNAEAHRRMEASAPDRPDPRPILGDLAPEDLRYYRDPLKRLIDLHTGGHEYMSGLGHEPLWP